MRPVAAPTSTSATWMAPKRPRSASTASSRRTAASEAAGAARLLLVVLQRFRHAGMDHVAHVRAIDAHAECDRGHDDVGALVDERLLVGAALLVHQPGVVAQRPEAAPREGRRQLVHLAAAN